MTNIEGTISIKLEEFLTVLEKANLFERILDEAEMSDPLGNGNPYLYIPAERVLEVCAPEIFAELTQKCRAEWDQKHKEMEESA